MPASGFSRQRFCCSAKSRASGTIGVLTGTCPISVPTTSSLLSSNIGVSVPSPNTARAASLVSARPGNGLPRSTANELANRVASTTSAAETALSWLRKMRAASVNHRAMVSGPGWLNR